MATIFNSGLPFPRNPSMERCGVSFTGIGDGCVVSMELDNGTAAKLMLPTGLVTSFKPQMWHGATMELLHTSVSQTQDAVVPLIRGGFSLGLACQNDDGFSWSPHAWELHQVTGTPQESIQVELRSTSEQGDVGIKHVITLEKDSFNSQILVSNSTTSSIRLAGSAVCHLAVSTPDATYALGLQGSDYFVSPPFHGNFSIIPPRTTDQYPNKLWPFNKLFPKREDDDINGQVESGEEEDDYKHLTETLSRIYTSAPRSLTIMDRGRRNSVTVRRQGFKELYIMSPGSEHEWYSKYSYICIGHAAQLEPVIIDAQSEWSGGVQLFNPNY
ncbi:protein NDH-DEPENDENT CYCLIC ELECTRON FLOW 5 [Salvia miltiorrhiza]|uniref:protein NDH-DEPENDENT CYCLIC ELECTRON FLOW 5 n=1 Tax=Salvia miltiorrhiza TaxID=226208 RepID=UPI0025AC1E92|nr:protein NDH-DEPENDENT CYCLIC ELECTRON FLOW 5 [Salvia miltiorrhiza]